MKTVRVTIDPADAASLARGRIDSARIDGTTEKDIARHKRADDAGAMQDAAKFARRVRRRLGFSQSEFAERIEPRLSISDSEVTYTLPLMLNEWIGSNDIH